jgi:hypothetical protein
MKVHRLGANKEPGSLLLEGLSEIVISLIMNCVTGLVH